MDMPFKKWPYPVEYGKAYQVETDVLFIGGGIAGCHGAISAAKRGAAVAVVIFVLFIFQ